MSWIAFGGWEYGPSIFAEGWADATYGPSGSLYDLVDASTPRIPLIKYTKGPMTIFAEDDFYSGHYTVGLNSISGGYPISGNWTFFIEHPVTNTGSGFTFHSYMNVTKIPDNYGKVQITLVPTGTFSYANLMDETGTSGGFFAMWAQLDSRYVTPYEMVPYRVVDLG